MLVLTRKMQERIHIGDNITITLVRIQGNTVRIGIEAPGDVRVVRGEVAVRDQLELAAAEAENPDLNLTRTSSGTYCASRSSGGIRSASPISAELDSGSCSPAAGLLACADGEPESSNAHTTTP